MCGENANDVTGSCTLVRFGGKQILLECGLYQDNSYLESYKINSKKFPFDPEEIDYVFVNHIHIDHCGLLPRLVKEGFHGPIIMTKASAVIAKHLLLNCAFILQDEARVISKRYNRDYQPIYTEDDVLMGTYTTDDKGMVIIKDLPLSNGKRYYILEKQTSDSSYLLNEEKMYFEINENGEVVKANMKNEKIKGSLEFTKVDLSTSNPIPNTKIEIYNADTNELIYSGLTDKNGKIIIDNLEYGRYYIKEVETASPDYILNTEKMYFEIRENGEVVKSTMTNEKVEMPKTFNTDLTSSIIIISTAVLGLGLLIYAKKKNK